MREGSLIALARGAAVLGRPDSTACLTFLPCLSETRGRAAVSLMTTCDRYPCLFLICPELLRFRCWGSSSTQLSPDLAITGRVGGEDAELLERAAVGKGREGEDFAPRHSEPRNRAFQPDARQGGVRAVARKRT